MFGRPTIIFSNKDTEVLSGSARSIDGLNIKKILDSVNVLDRSIFLKYGGHSGAAGMSIYKEKFNHFYDLFEQELNKELTFLNGRVNIGPIIFTDGSISHADINMSTVKRIKLLEPFGRGFEAPVFQADAVLINKKMVGKEQQHAQLSLNFSGKIVKGIWFNAKTHNIIYNLNLNKKVLVVFKLGEEFFNGQHNLSAIVEYIVKI
jgi:single-stranded-DNA-specific exonuclease